MAARIVAGELPDFPYLPELPARGPGADLAGRTAALLIDMPVETTPGGWRIATRPLRPLSDNGTVVVVKEPRGAVLTPLAVPMSLAAGRQNSCNSLNAVGDLRCSRAYGAVYAGGIPDG